MNKLKVGDIVTTRDCLSKGIYDSFKIIEVIHRYSASIEKYYYYTLNSSDYPKWDTGEFKQCENDIFLIDKQNKSIKFRFHRGSLALSMETTIEVYSKIELFCKIFQEHSKIGECDYRFEDMTIDPYGRDYRIGWDTYMVCINGNAVGFADGNFKEEPIFKMEGEMPIIKPKRKIIQIDTCFVSSSYDPQTQISIYAHVAITALCNDGTLWGLDALYKKWKQLPDIP